MLKALGRDIAIYGGADFTFKLIQFAAIPFYAHRLSVAEFGTLALLQVSAVLIGGLANLGVNYSVQRYYFDAGIPAERRPLLVSTGLVQMTITGIFTLAALGLLIHGERELLWERYQLPWVLIVVALLTILPDQVAQYALDTSRLQFAPLRFCTIALVKNVLGLLIGLWLLVEHDMGLLGLFLGNLASASLAVPLGLWLIRRDLTLGIDIDYLKMMLRFGSPFVFTVTAYWVFGSLDRWMLAELSDAVQVGLFSIAFKFASVMALVITAFHQAWVPVAMRMANENPGYRQIYSAIFSRWLLLLALLALALSLFADEVMMLLTPPEYWAAATPLAIGAAALALSGTTQITALGITLEKRTSLLAAGAWLAALVNVGLNYMLIPRYGASGAAVATLLSYACLTLFYLFWSQRLHRIPLQNARLLYGGLLIAAALAAPLLLDAEPFNPTLMALKLSILAGAVFGAVAAGLLSFDLLRQLALPGASAQ